MIETHVHFNHEALAADLPAVLARAADAGITDFIVVGFDEASSERAVALAADPRIRAAVGLHPHDALHWNDAFADRLRAWATRPEVVAIGEIGLDFYRDLAPRPAQFDAFHAQLALARDTGLPVIIHCRDAYDETLDQLEDEAGDLTIVLHCFSGARRHAERAWSRGWLLGVDGPVTYKKNDALRAIVRDAPAELLLLETDAPYLSPEPLRGRFPNEPSRLPWIAAAVAAARGETVAAVEAATTANARRTFPRLRAA